MTAINSGQYVLVTGGLGYIGSHTIVELLNADKNVIVLDNLCNSKVDVVDKIFEITNKNIIFIKGDIRDSDVLKLLFSKYDVDSVIHFAALKSVDESFNQPLQYFDANIHGTLCLLREMNHAKVKKVVFSSSAAVYGNVDAVPIKEFQAINPISPYGYTKAVCERILQDLHTSDNSWKIIILRYFNPVGTHSSGLIGESPANPSNNLIPVIAEIIIKGQGELRIFGDDYSTDDGSGVRDYIHVEDLAKGHLQSLLVINDISDPLVLNLGTGNPYSVFEVLKTFEKIIGKKIPFQVKNRRLGDIGKSFADVTLVRDCINWTAQIGLNRMCQDALNWAKKTNNKS